MIQPNYFKPVKNYLHRIFNPQSNNEEPSVNNGLYHQLLSLEESYNDKLLLAHNINPSELKEACAKINDYNERTEFRKRYIMENANLTETEYQEIFVHPLSQITQTKENTMSDLKTTYEDIKEKIDKLEDLIDLIKP